MRRQKFLENWEAFEAQRNFEKTKEISKLKIDAKSTKRNFEKTKEISKQKYDAKSTKRNFCKTFSKESKSEISFPTGRVRGKSIVT